MREEGILYANICAYRMKRPFAYRLMAATLKGPILERIAHKYRCRTQGKILKDAFGFADDPRTPLRPNHIDEQRRNPARGLCYKLQVL